MKQLFIFLALILFTSTTEAKESIKSRLHSFCERNLIAFDPTDSVTRLKSMNERELFNHYWKIRERYFSLKNPTWQELDQASVDRFEMRYIERFFKWLR